MTRACHMAVNDAVGKDVFSEKEIDELLDRLVERQRRVNGADPTLTQREALSKAAGEITREALYEGLTARRMQVFADLAKGRRRTWIEKLLRAPNMNGTKALEALTVGLERQGWGTMQSVDALGRAHQAVLWGDLKTALEKMPGLIDKMSNFWGVAENGFMRKVAKELARVNGDGSVEPTGDEAAVFAARAIAGSLDAARQLQNAHGAVISKIEGYIVRQSHDPLKIAGGFWGEVGETGRRLAANGIKNFNPADLSDPAYARAFGKWRDFLMPLLHPKTFDGIDLEDIPLEKWNDEAQEARQLSRQDKLKQAQALHTAGIIKDPTDVREMMLHSIFVDILTGRHEEMSGASDLGEFRPKASLARAVSKSRVLHFISPDAWMDYNEKYGRGTMLSAVMQQLGRAGQNAALMHWLGPNPEAAFDAERGRLVNDARLRGDVKDIQALNGPKTQARLEEVNGRSRAAVNLRLASVMRTMRTLASLTKLGAIVLSKPFDFVATGQTFARYGGGYLDGYKAAFFNGVLKQGGATRKAVLDALDVGARGFAGHMGAQYLATDGVGGWASWATRLMYKLNSFEWFNDAIQQGAAHGYAALLGHERTNAYENLSPGFRETFERFGIGAEDWENARHGLTPQADGRHYFTMDHLENLAKEGVDDAGAATPAKLTGDQAAELRMKFTTLFHNLIADTTNEPRAREHVFMAMGTKAGTPLGEFVRSFWQFKGFVNTIVGRQLVPAARGYAGRQPVALLAHLILGSVVAGYVSMTAKQLARGEMPRSPIGGGPANDAKVWLGALAQGGGLGLYGDFLFGELNRNGSDFGWGTLGGPLIGESETIAKIVRQAVSGGAVNTVSGRSQIPGELIKLGSQNIPLINLWYTRLALDYFLLWGMQEKVSPGYLDRYQQRVENQEGSSFWAPPTSAVHY